MLDFQNTVRAPYGLYIFHSGLEFRAVSVTDTLGTKLKFFNFEPKTRGKRFQIISGYDGAGTEVKC